MRIAKFDHKKHKDPDLQECLICDHRFKVGLVVTIDGFQLPYCGKCVDRLHEALHAPSLT